MHQIVQTSSKNRAGLLIAIGLAVALISVVGVTATAQSGTSPAQLRRENDQLKERITELEAALEESQRQIDRLEKQIAATPKQSNTGKPQTTTPTQTAPRPAPHARRVPASPSACPDALYESLVDSYNETFPGIERPAFSEVQQWVRRVGRDRQRTEWLVRVYDTTLYQGRMSSAVVNTIDPKTGEDICNNFSIQLPYKDALRIRDAADVKYWIIEGTLTAKPFTDRSRADFNENVRPKIVGPYAVFGWEFDVDEITPSAGVLDEDTPAAPKR